MSEHKFQTMPLKLHKEHILCLWCNYKQIVKSFSSNETDGFCKQNIQGTIYYPLANILLSLWKKRLLFYFYCCCKRIFFTKFCSLNLVVQGHDNCYDPANICHHISSHHPCAWFLMHYKSNFKEGKKSRKRILPCYRVKRDDGFDTPCKRALPTIYTFSHYHRRSKTYTKRYFA